MTSAVREKELFRGRTVLIMIMVGVLSFSALAVLSVFAPSLRSGDDGGVHSLSKSGVGFAGIVKLLQLRGQTVVVSRGDSPAARGGGLMVMTPAPQHDASAVKAVPFNGRRLVVLPKWATFPHQTRRGWVRHMNVLPAEAVSESGGAEAWAPDARIRRRAGPSRPTLTFDTGQVMPAGSIANLQTLATRRLVPVVTDEEGRTVLARTKDGKVYVLSDPDLLNTMGLKQLANASAGEALIDRARPPRGPLVFDVSLHGFKRARNVFSLALEPPFLGGTLCAVAAALLAGIAAAMRFGPVRRAPPPYAMGKGALIDNTAGLIRMARREHRMAAGYARLCRDLAARAVGAPRQLEPAALDAFLDRLSEQRGALLFTDLARAAAEAANLTELMAVTRKLYDWRLEMTRASR